MTSKALGSSKTLAVVAVDPTRKPLDNIVAAITCRIAGYRYDGEPFPDFPSPRHVRLREVLESAEPILPTKPRVIDSWRRLQKEGLLRLEKIDGQLAAEVEPEQLRATTPGLELAFIPRWILDVPDWAGESVKPWSGLLVLGILGRHPRARNKQLARWIGLSISTVERWSPTCRELCRKRGANVSQTRVHIKLTDSETHAPARPRPREALDVSSDS